MWIRQSKKLLARNYRAKEIGVEYKLAADNLGTFSEWLGDAKGVLGGLEIPPLKLVAGNVTTAGLAVQK